MFTFIFAILITPSPIFGGGDSDNYISEISFLKK